MYQKMNTNEIIALQKEIAALEHKKTAAVAEVTVAEVELKAAAGYKSSIARSKVRDAENVVADHDAAIAALREQLSTDKTQVWFCRYYAEYELTRDARLATIADLEVKLAAAQEEAKKGAWKRAKVTSGQPTTGVSALQTQIAAENAAITALEATNKGIIKTIADYRTKDVRDAEFAIWLAGGPQPEYLRIRDEFEREELLRGCVSLKLSRGEPCTFIVPSVQEEEPSEWVPMTAEQYLHTLMPPPMEIKEEVFVPSTCGNTPGWITRIVAARAKKVAPITIDVS